MQVRYVAVTFDAEGGRGVAHAGHLDVLVRRRFEVASARTSSAAAA